MKHILGISRSTRFSPNSVERDAAIFAAVTSRLQRYSGNDISIISEDLFVAVDLVDFDVVYSMARGKDVVECLAEVEQNGIIKIVNSANALLKTDRARLDLLFQQNNIPIPDFEIIDLSQENTHSTSLSYPMWIKRGDAPAQVPGDVLLVQTPEQLQAALSNFCKKSYKTAVLSQHKVGDLVKFYGVEGTDFFTYSYPTEGNNFSKFGLEKFNGRPRKYDFDEKMFKSIADKCALVSGFTIYGGDAVISADGIINIIDFNDWPSFSACRKEAAKAIALKINNL